MSTNDDAVFADEIVFTHMGVPHVAVSTDERKNDYTLFDIYDSEDKFVDSIHLHPSEDVDAALTTWSAYH